MIIHCLIIVLFFIPLSFQQAQKFPNIDFVSKGYDIYVGNPQNSLHDPGFKQSVFELSYKENSKSADGRWLIPDNVQVSAMISCKLNVESFEIFGSTSYQESLSQDMKIELGVFKNKFTASSGFKKVREETSSNKKVYVSSVAKCINYEALIKYPLEITLAKEVVNAIADLPTLTSTPANADAYSRFIQSFGTHYARGIYMGAKAIEQSEFEETKWAQLKQDGINVKTGASASFLGATAGGEYSREEDSRSKTEFENKRSTHTFSYQGAHPPGDKKWETWAMSTGQSPYPIRYTLQPLSELLDARYIKNIHSSTLLIKKNLLDGAIQRYCQQLDGCMDPAPDQIPPIPAKMSKVVSDFRYQTQVFCPNNNWLLSCGMRMSQRKKVDHARSWYPINDRACTCSDWGGATCQAWCSDVKVEMSIANPGSKRGFSEAYCPWGTVVVGCHMKASNSREWWKGSYPRNGYCKCYDGQESSECIATCAPGKYISDYAIKEQQGKGVIDVECSGRAIVLGCGYMPSGSGANYERYRDVSVESEKVCRCYDWFGGTCFAICGYIKRP